ncbi:hypothetical protein HSIEG1_2770 [Enterococcus sp. HSIEG1]|nr:hypothetical protein HSIEG1_2770 [Enterococcus sp. HSIEG1]
MHLFFTKLSEFFFDSLNKQLSPRLFLQYGTIHKEVKEDEEIL